jgi:hypothetical protein
MNAHIRTKQRNIEGQTFRMEFPSSWPKSLFDAVRIDMNAYHCTMSNLSKYSFFFGIYEKGTG